jgi:AcrR family transcriptional regulator
MVALVNEQGYEAISVDGLAQRADVTRATFYAHYANKAELLTAVVDAFADDVIAALDDPSLAAGPRVRLQILFERARQTADVLRIIVRGEGDGAPLRRFTDRVERVLAEDFEAGRRPAIHADVERDLLIAMRAAQIVAAVAWFVEKGDGADPAEVADQVTAVIEHVHDDPDGHQCGGPGAEPPAGPGAGRT